MKKELREAVETLEDIKGSVEFYEKDKPEYSQAITKAQKFIESYLSIQGFPEEMNVPKSIAPMNEQTYWYNQAIQDCKQATLATQDKWYGAGYVDGQNALLKKMDGITPEFLHNEYLKTVKHLHPESFNPVANKPYDELTDEQKSIDIFIAQAIKDHIVGRNISNETLDTQFYQTSRQ